MRRWRSLELRRPRREENEVANVIGDFINGWSESWSWVIKKLVFDSHH